MRGYAAIGLYKPKTPANVGGALRAAGCYGASIVVVGAARMSVNACTDTQKVHRHIPVLRMDDLRSAVPVDCIPIAVDLLEGAVPLPEFTHPERAFYVFGPEDGTLGDDVLEWCKHRVFVPTRYCMNLAATVNVLLYDRMSKRGWRKGVR